MKKALILLVVTISLYSACGKKLPPTSPDRWAPRVLNVQPVDEHHLKIFFSERVDTLTSGKLVNYQIVDHERAETTAIIYAEREKQGDEVLVTIAELAQKEYSLLVYNIKDLHGNLMRFAEKGFSPSTDRDTSAPLLKYTKPSRVLTSAPAESTIFLRFTEPMDTAAASLDDFIQTNLTIDSALTWNKTLTELTLRYRLDEGKMSRLFVLPKVTDLSGNPLAELRILGLTTNDTIPRNRLNIDIEAPDTALANAYGFFSLARGMQLYDIVRIDTLCSFSVYFATPDTYLMSIIGEHPEDTSGMWWGEGTIEFYPDTTRSMNAVVPVSFVTRGDIPERLFEFYELLYLNIRKKK
jgi:hypothetical protein